MDIIIHKLWEFSREVAYGETANGLAKMHWDDALTLLILTPVIYSAINFFWLPPKREAGFDVLFSSPQRSDGLMDQTKDLEEDTRDICLKMNKLNKDVIVFWGSQSGRAARLAKQFAKELQSCHGIAALADDLDSYDHHHLVDLAKDKVVGFVVSTFGEGDPPDNAAELWDQLQQWSKNAGSLSNLKFFAFGLGSSKYHHYNRFVDVLCSDLLSCGADQIGPVGKLDEVSGSEAAWVAWKKDMLRALTAEVAPRDTESIKSMFEPDIDIIDITNPGASTHHVLHAGEEHARQSRGRVNLYVAPIRESRLLSAPGSRPYVHIEFDTGGAGQSFTYETGDHVAIWPVNRTCEADRLARLFAWDDKKLHRPMHVREKSELADQASLPSGLTTRRALLRYHLDICGPVARQNLATLAHFSPTPTAKSFLTMLLEQDDQWESVVVDNCLTYGEVMEMSDPTPSLAWPEELFLLLIQSIPPLQPRYFSIASSSVISKQRIAVTAGIVNTACSNNRQFLGLTTNYLYALHHQMLPKGQLAAPNSLKSPSYDLDGPRGSLTGEKAFIHIRPSNFKLPRDPSTPIIMVAAGSGIAPFIGFLQEREACSKAGEGVGKTCLFFGCRTADQDFLYADVLQRMEKDLSWFSLDVAFSRQSPEHKEYVQDRIERRVSEVLRTLTIDDGVLYICGSIDMARDVKELLVRGMVAADGIGGEEDARKSLDNMKLARRLQEDVWA